MNGTPLTHNVFAFIQARTTSTRLPNKVLKTFVNNKCILNLLVDRIEKILPKEKIVLLIPHNDISLIRFANEMQISFFEGSEFNVRQRFINAAKHFQAEWILRLTGDNPFVDIEHLQYLIEATRFTNYDLITFENLPIGMGAEIFRADALKREPTNGIRSEHEEHVSLHIKQFPNEYQVLRLRPFISHFQNTSKIRLTIDEEVDFKVCQDIYLEFQNNSFGVKEILELFAKKPELFHKNQTVKQVSFFIPEYSSQNKPKVLIIYAPVQKYGSAHFRRMKLLKIYLESQNFDVTLTDSLQDFESDLNYKICILDYRDEKLPKQANSQKWIKLDNFSNREDKESFVYTLPHPKLKLEEYKDSLLTPMSYFFVQPKPQRKGVLVYVGGVKETMLPYLLEWIKQNFPNENITVVGKKVSNPQIICFENLTFFSFYELLSNSEYFISYFGQSLLEAFFLGCKCFSFSISPYHTELSLFMEKNYFIPFLGELEKNNLILKTLHTTSKLHYNLFGYKILISLIQNKLKNLIE